MASFSGHHTRQWKHRWGEALYQRNRTNGSGSTAINTATTADLVIGRDGTSGSAYFNGQIDDVRLYGAELNATLIGQLYGNGNGDFNRLTVKAAGTVTITATQPGITVMPRPLPARLPQPLINRTRRSPSRPSLTSQWATLISPPLRWPVLVLE